MSTVVFIHKTINPYLLLVNAKLDNDYYHDFYVLFFCGEEKRFYPLIAMIFTDKDFFKLRNTRNSRKEYLTARSAQGAKNAKDEKEKEENINFTKQGELLCKNFISLAAENNVI